MLDTNVTPCAIIDGEFETESCIEQISGYNDESVCHLIFSNHTWLNSDIVKLSAFYQSQPSLLRKVLKVQDNCEPDAFKETLRKCGLQVLPVYSKAIEVANLSTESTARVYHDPKEYLENGSPTNVELTSFVRLVMKTCLAPLFSLNEISSVIKVKLNLFDRLFEVTSKNEAIVDVEDITRVDSEAIDSIRGLLKIQDFCNLRGQIDRAVARFLVSFALHTIRTHCKCSFGVDGELKFYDREMHSASISDLAAAKKNMAPRNIKAEQMVKAEKRTFAASVKLEKQKILEDDDFCEIIDAAPSKKRIVEIDRKPTVSRLPPQPDAKEKSTIEDSENDVIEKMNKSQLDDWVKWGVRNLINSNRTLRKEIDETRAMLGIKLEEQKSKYKPS